MTSVEPRFKTQTDHVLDYLRNQGPLNQITAREELGVLRLGARIWDLKQRGYSIRTELVEAVSEFGPVAGSDIRRSGARVAQYSLVPGLWPSPGGASAPVPDITPEITMATRRQRRLPLDDPPAEERDDPRADDPRADAPARPRTQDDAPRTLDDALWVFGDRMTELGVCPTVREFQAALGVASESVAHRWLRVLEREGLLALNALIEGPSARRWLVTPDGYERLYHLERRRRVASESPASFALDRTAAGGAGAAGRAAQHRAT